MNIQTDTDTIDGRNSLRQAGLWVFYILGTIAMFCAIKYTMLFLTEYALGAEKAKSFASWVSIPTIFLLSKLLQSFEKEFWVNPKGNHVQPTINVFLSKTIDENENTGTRFIVYTTGFALKWPWEKKSDIEIEVEREEIHPHQQFTVSAEKGASLIIEMVLAWKPFPQKLSSFLQSAGHDPLHPPILKQIAAKAQQLFEEYTAGLTDSEELRKTQTKAIKIIMEGVEPSPGVRDFEGVQSFAQKFGIDIFDISLTKCDYSPDDQKIRNKALEGQVLLDLTEKLYADGDGGYTTRPEAVRAAQLVLGIANITDHRSIFKVEIDSTGLTPETAELLRGMDLNALAVLIANKLNKK